MNRFGYAWRLIVCLTVILVSIITDAAEPQRPELIKLPVSTTHEAESTPVIYEGRPLLVLSHRVDTQHGTPEYTKNMYLYIKDMATGKQIARFGDEHYFACAIVNGKQMNVFAAKCEGPSANFKSIYRYCSDDLKTWKRELAIPLEDGEGLHNCSVCRDEQGYVMAYESNKPVAYCFKFARSEDLATWKKVPGLVFAGEKDEYSACPVIRYFAPYYYVIYLHTAIPGHNGYVPFMARSKDLATWELSPMNPITEAGLGEGKNNSDFDLFEWQGNTYLFYATGDQGTWYSLRTAMYRGPMKEFFEGWFPEGINGVSVSAKKD